MATVAFLMDIEEGHIIPSFGLAQSLRERGHRVFYLSVPDNRKLVMSQGFEYYPVLEEIYPEGYNERYKKERISGRYKDPVTKEHFRNIVNGSFDRVVNDIKPDLLICSAFLNLEALLLYYIYNIRPVIFTPFLRHASSSLTTDCINHIMKLPTDAVCALTDFISKIGVRFTSLPALVEPLVSFPELVVCPPELEPEHHLVKGNVHFIEPSIRKPEPDGLRPALTEKIKGAKTIYASLGSQAAAYGEASQKFFRQIVNVMKRPEMSACHLVLAVGKEFDTKALGNVPLNVTVEQWVPQISMLQTASLAITHGGLGTIKECIYYGVPMIVFPLKHDQPYNAKLVEYHQLGLCRQIDDLTEDGITSMILSLLNDQHIMDHVQALRKVFHAYERSQPGARIVEDLLSLSGLLNRYAYKPL